MPHLTDSDVTAAGRPRPGCRKQPGEEGWGRLALGVPGLAHPLLAPAEWGGLSRSGASLDWVVLNVSGGRVDRKVSGGPGERPDPHCLEAVGRLRNAGVCVLGHLDLCGGERPHADLIGDACHFLEWYRVDGFLLDRCPADRAALSRVCRTTAMLEVLSDDGHLVLGQGVHPYPGYAEAADQLITFCGHWTEYRWSQVAEWTADYPAERFAHVVQGVPRTHLEEAARIARWQGASTVFFTDRTERAARAGHSVQTGRSQRIPEYTANTAFDTLPGYWDEIVSQIGLGVSE
ncbi:spherulation-specific family 4 protein [Streptomyces sp. MUM 178J]|uniref:spherulation-specific family 4 protein n=1 Tax=Streptomyces sp. MUM 178J TaxID=2791991 RepID=UPI001F04726E|nr:spherulation-specific family 4 protein [Streptomyces sp. MUM 178J]WRQ81414.1 spherulation-specific family 4 protein [Streptomyces sp. MUM 178J]